MCPAPPEPWQVQSLLNGCFPILTLGCSVPSLRPDQCVAGELGHRSKLGSVLLNGGRDSSNYRKLGDRHLHLERGWYSSGGRKCSTWKKLW